jgi:hypothetical protein
MIVPLTPTAINLHATAGATRNTATQVMPPINLPKLERCSFPGHAPTLSRRTPHDRQLRMRANRLPFTPAKRVRNSIDNMPSALSP